jgi:hypothetical protein
MDNSHVELKTFTAEPDDAAFGYIQASASPEAPTSGTMPLTRTGTTTTTNDACSALPEGSLAGKVALIRRGTCTFHVKSLNAQNAGAIGVVLYNNNPPNAGLFSATVAGTPAITIPVVSVSDGSGANLAGRIPTALTDTVDITWTDDTGVFPNPTAGQPSSFTSWGLPPSLNFKPDVAAPGGLIKSAWPMEDGGVATISGTSMAAPHVSGAAALYLEEHGPTNPLALREAFQNSADPAMFNPSFAQAAHRQGAGMIDIDDAITATSSVSPAKLALGEGTAAQTKTLEIFNGGDTTRTYSLFHDPAVGTSPSTYAPAAFGNFPGVSFSPSSVDVPAGETRTVDVTITPVVAASTNRSIYGGYIRVVASGEAPLRVPFAGFTGDYQSIQALAPGACTFPGIFKAGGETTCGTGANPPKLAGWTRQTDGATYDVSEVTDRPIALFHLAHPAQRVEIRAVNAGGEEFLVARTDFAARNPTNDLTPPGQSTGPGFFVYTWDGKSVASTGGGKLNRREVPLGQYKLELKTTDFKALNEAANAPAAISSADPEARPRSR